MSNLRYRLLEVSLKTSSRMIGSLTLESMSIVVSNQFMILNGAVTVTSYLICVFDTIAWGESALLSEEYRVVDRVMSLLRICMQQEVLIFRQLMAMK